TNVAAAGVALNSSSTGGNNSAGALTVTSGATGSVNIGTLTGNGFGGGTGSTVIVTGGTGGLTLGTITANGGITGNGGNVTVTGASASALTLAAISAQGGGTSGNGGSVSIINLGNGTNGGITVTNTSINVGET